MNFAKSEMPNSKPQSALLSAQLGIQSEPYRKLTHYNKIQTVLLPIFPVNPYCVLVQQLPLVAFVSTGDELVGHLHPGAQVAGDGANRPVATPDDAIPTELLQAVLHVRPDSFQISLVRCAVGQNTGYLAGDVGESGDLTDVTTPGVELARCDVGDATVVQDELHARTFRGQVRRQRNLPRQYAKVKREFVFFQQADVRNKAGPLGQLIRFDVQNPPEAHEVRRQH